MKEVIIREFRKEDLGELKRIYRESFRGFPWHEELSDEEVERRISRQFSLPGFQCLVACVDDRLVGGIWWDEMTQVRLETERGGVLAQWVSDHWTSGGKLIWARELVVDPNSQNQGIGTELRKGLLAALPKGSLVLTRYREDNLPTIKIARKLGYDNTGVGQAASEKPWHHYFWYKVI